MQTALFIVTLTRTQDATCRVSKRVRKGDMDRAILLGATWLTKTQRLYDYFGVTYDMYEIFKQNDNGDWVNIETGGVQDAEKRRADLGAQKDKAQARSMAAPLRGRNKPAAAGKGGRLEGVLFNTDNLPPKGGAKRGSTSKSALRQRIDAEMKLAMQRAQQRKATGDS